MYQVQYRGLTSKTPLHLDKRIECCALNPQKYRGLTDKKRISMYMVYYITLYSYNEEPYGNTILFLLSSVQGLAWACCSSSGRV